MTDTHVELEDTLYLLLRDPLTDFHQLSPRQLEVVFLVAQGLDQGHRIQARTQRNDRQHQPANRLQEAGRPLEARTGDGFTRGEWSGSWGAGRICT